MEGKAETEGFEPSVELPLHTLSKRAPSATRTSLQFFTGWQKYSFNIYNPNIFSALAVVIAATSFAETFFIKASFSTIYCK
jgi:hypothetical protein